MYKGNTAWMPKYENGMSEVWVYFLKQKQRAVVACNILTCELIQCGSFSQMALYDLNMSNIKRECDFNNINVIKFI
jgi:hypothetical protein